MIVPGLETATRRDGTDGTRRQVSLSTGAFGGYVIPTESGINPRADELGPIWRDAGSMTPSMLNQDSPPRPLLSTAFLVFASILIALGCFAVVGLMFSGAYWDADDNPAAFYRAEVIEHGRNLQTALLIPAASMVLGVIAWSSASAAGARVRGSYWAVGLSVMVGVAMIYVGNQNIELATRYAQQTF